MNRLKLLGFMVCIVFAALATDAQTKITVSKDVIRKADEFEPLGVNKFGDGGQTHHANGNLVRNGSFEPVRVRKLYRVLDSGKDKGKCWITLDGPGTSQWLTYNSGLFSGGTMRVYRFVDADGQPLPYKEAG
jgi:hypothetical protein